MATNTLNIRIALKGDTAANWATSALVLLKNEPAVETDTGRFKFGDGVKTFAELPYADVSEEEIKNLITTYAVNSVSIATGDTNGQLKLTVDGKATNVSVKGLGDAAYQPKSAFATDVYKRQRPCWQGAFMSRLCVSRS